MFKPQYKQLINMDRIKIKYSDMCKSWSNYHYSIIFCFFSHYILFSSTSEMRYRYGSVLAHSTYVPYLQCCYGSLVSTRLLKLLHKDCNMDMLRVLLIYPHSPSGAVHPQDNTYICISQTPCCRVTTY